METVSNEQVEVAENISTAAYATLIWKEHGRCSVFLSLVGEQCFTPSCSLHWGQSFSPHHQPSRGIWTSTQNFFFSEPHSGESESPVDTEGKVLREWKLRIST